MWLPEMASGRPDLVGLLLFFQGCNTSNPPDHLLRYLLLGEKEAHPFGWLFTDKCFVFYGADERT